MARYSVEGDEGTFEPGSDGQVLKNKLGIVDPADMQAVELELLFQLYSRVLNAIRPDEPLTVAMVKEWHRQWLGNVYEWAGWERSVNLSKDGFPFAPAAQIPSLLEQFDRQCLARRTPCAGMGREEALAAIAEAHVELVLIHPFREGNGRIARLLADVMANQAGLGLLDYTPWGRDRARYFAAIQEGLGGSYGLMAELVRRALDS